MGMAEGVHGPGGGDLGLRAQPPVLAQRRLIWACAVAFAHKGQRRSLPQRLHGAKPAPALSPACKLRSNSYLFTRG